MSFILDGSEKNFFAFLGEYRALIQKHIPGNYVLEYDSRLYMLPVHRHLERVAHALPEGARVLDLGCGRGHFAAYLQGRGLKVVGLEVKDPAPGDDFIHNQDPKLIENYPALWAEANASYGCECGYFDGRSLPLPDASLDCVLFYATFEHIPVLVLPHMLNEAFRTLRPGGKVFIYRCPSQWSWSEHVAAWLGMGHHEKLYRKGEALGLLKTAGFGVDFFTRSDFFPVHLEPLQGIVNALAKPILALECVLKWTPLAFIYHDFVIEAHKP